MISSTSKVKIPFHDIDIMDVAWHGHYAKYFEIARTDLMRSIGLDYPQLIDLNIAMPVVDFSVRYIRALKYGDEPYVTATIKDFHYPELVINYEIKNSKNQILTKGMTRQIYMSINDMQVQFEVPEGLLVKYKANEN